MTRIASLAALALLAATPAHSAQWKELADTAFGQLFIDTASVHHDGTMTTFQYRIDAKAPQKNPAKGTTYRSTVVDMSVQCAARMGSMTQLLAFSEPEGKGTLVDRETLRQAPHAIAAGSSDELLMQAACAAK